MPLSIDDAWREIAAAAAQLAGGRGPEAVGLAEACGRLLAEDVRADRDSPPFGKSLMDGFAVRAAETAGGRRTLPVAATVTAGAAAAALPQGASARIMTGAPLPAGADAVVPQELCDDSEAAVRLPADVSVGRSVLPRAAEYAAGAVVARAGDRIGPAIVGVLAAVGCVRPKVVRRTRVAVLSTGDEIVAADRLPADTQLRDSNGPLLAAALREAGCAVRSLGPVPDDRTRLAAAIADGLTADVLVVSGGVSVGRRDHIPELLAAAGVRRRFHGVALRPGKPLWFGATDTALAFGLPGNPVSSLVGLDAFVLPALGNLERPDTPLAPTGAAVLSAPLPAAGRPTLHPVRLDVRDATLAATPIPWSGSWQLHAVTAADAWALAPDADTPLPAGSLVRLVRRGPTR